MQQLPQALQDYPDIRLHPEYFNLDYRFYDEIKDEYEIFVPVIINGIDYTGLYEISSWGRVKSLDRIVNHKGQCKQIKIGKILKQNLNKRGYAFTYLSKNGKDKTCQVHRLVAEAFIPNPKNKPQVNHINGIKHDNRAEKLEWVTGSENVRHAIKTGLVIMPNGKNHPSNKPVLQYNLNKEFIGEYYSGKKAQDITGINKTKISECCNNKRKTAGGYIWRFKDSD